MSYKKSTAKDEEDLKEYTSSKAKETTAKKQTSLEDKLKELDIPYSQFKGADELFRKRCLKENYQEVKNEYGWQYDQPIQ